MPSEQQILLNRALGFRYKSSRRSSWRLKDEKLVSLVESAISIIDGKGIDNDQHLSTLIKREDNRHVFRIDSKEDSKSYVVKVFPLRCLRHRLKYRHMAKKFARFAYGEAVGLLKATENEIKVPEVYGYGSIPGASGLILKSVLIIEFLSHHTTIGDLIELNSHDQDKCLSILKRSIPLYVQLYNAACNHISVNSGAIMFDDNGCVEEDYLLDFEYARFYAKPSHELLMYEAATLAKYCKSWVTDGTFKAWVIDLLGAIGVDESAIRDSLMLRFYFHFETQLTRKQRSSIGTFCFFS